MDKQNTVYAYGGVLSSLRGNEVLTPAPTWMDLEDITLSEVSQIGKQKHYMIPLVGGAPLPQQSDW